MTTKKLPKSIEECNDMWCSECAFEITAESDRVGQNDSTSVSCQLRKNLRRRSKK